MGSGTQDRSARDGRGDRQREGDGTASSVDFTELPVGSVAELRTLERVPEGFYSALPPDLEREEIRDVLPFWTTKSSSGGGISNLHFPAEGSTRDDPEYLCGSAVDEVRDADIPVYPPGHTGKCSRCYEAYRSRAEG